MTASFLGGLLWIVFVVAVAIATRNFAWFFTICGCTDLIGRAMGMKSTWYFIPIWILALIGNFLFAGISLDSREDQRATFNAPPKKSAKEVWVQLYNRPDGEPDIEFFKLPSDASRKLLKALDGAREDESPAKWQILGTVRIVLESRSFDIQLFQTGKNLGAFMVNDVYFRGSSDKELLEIITGAYEGGE